jgi:hypothetical protein
MILFMWQDDIIGVARSTDACFERVFTPAGHGPLVGDQASDQPDSGWKRCNDSSSSSPPPWHVHMERLRICRCHPVQRAYMSLTLTTRQLSDTMSKQAMHVHSKLGL